MREVTRDVVVVWDEHLLCALAGAAPPCPVGAGIVAAYLRWRDVLASPWLANASRYAWRRDVADVVRTSAGHSHQKHDQAAMAESSARAAK